MSDDMSQGTFDVIWPDLEEAIELAGNYEANQAITVKEISQAEFEDMYGVNIALLFDKMNDNNEDEHDCGTLKKDKNENEQDCETVKNNNNEEEKDCETDNNENDQDCSKSKPEFLNISATDVRQIIAGEDNKNTLKKTLSDVSKFQRFLSSKGENRELTELDPDVLDEYVANFILSVRKQDGEEYEPCTIRNFISSLDRKLKRQKYPYRIIGEQSNAFQLSRDALHAKQKKLKRLGKGNKPMQASPITDSEIDILYQKDVLGPKNGKSLLNTIWLNNCILFGLRGTKENHDLRWGDVQLQTGSDGKEYLELKERQTKTRTGTNIRDVRPVTPKIFASPHDPERCPVFMYKLYKTKRPSGYCEPDHPFYISPRTSSQKIDENSWYMKMPLGIKKISGLLRAMAVDGGLDSKKRLTNHSARKHLVQKLRDSGIAPTDIMQISGHRNIQSVMNYSAMSEEKHKQCSKILSSARPRPSSTATYSDHSSDAYNVQADQYLGSGTHESGINNGSGNVSAALSTSAITVFPSDIEMASLSDVNVPNTMSQSPGTVSSLPHPPRLADDNSVSLVNNQMSALFSGAVLNVHNFNVYMK